MSATTLFSTAAKTPYSEAASLEHYNRKTLEQLKVLAKLHGVSDAGESPDIVARLMESDRKSKTWPGMHNSETNVVYSENIGEDSAVEPVKQAFSKDEMPPGTLVTAVEKGKPNGASTATFPDKNRAAASMVIMTACGSKNDTAIPMPQLAEEWDGQWGPPYAFAKPAAIDTKSRGTSVTTAGSTPTRSKTPVSPISPASSVSPSTPASSNSSKLNRYDVLIGDEDEDEEVVGEVPRMEEVIKKSPSVQQKLVATPSIKKVEEVEEEEEEKAALANNNLHAGEKTKKKKRGKKGGKKVNKAKTDTELSAGTETDTTEASTSDAGAGLEQTDDIQSLVSPAKSESTRATVEPAIDVSGPIPVLREYNGAIVEPSPSVAPTEMDESVDEHIDLAESKPTEDVQEAFPTTPTLAPEQINASPLVEPPSEQTVKTPKKVPIQVFPIAPPLPLSPTQSTLAYMPAKTKNQRRNEKRKETKKAVSSNLYDVLVPDQPADPPVLDLSNAKEDNNGNSGVGAAPAAKKNKRGTKGGKKAQAQKKNQPVPVVKSTVASVVQSAVAGKVELTHLASVVAIAILAVAVGTWARG
jgi:hypothetical protein